MRKRILISVFTIALALQSTASDQLSFDLQETADATIYNLQLRQGQVVRTIWSRSVPLINGKKPDDYCSLRGWAKNEHGLMALVANNEFLGQLLQFNPNGELVAELEPGGSWLQDLRGGGSIKLEPPDKIEVTSPDGSVAKFMIRDGKMADESGKLFERSQPLQIRSKSSESGANSSPASTVPAARSNSTPPVSAAKVPLDAKATAEATSEESASSTLWSIIVVLTVAALGLLWLLIKRRSRS